MLKQLWQDESGTVITTELLLVNSVLVAGIASGLGKLSGAINSEINDVATSVGNLNQSYMYTSVASPSAATTGSSFNDQADPTSPSSVCTQLYGVDWRTGN